MSHTCCVYTYEELEKLDDEGRKTLQKALKKQIQASEEISAMISADAVVKKVLKKKLHQTYVQLTKKKKSK